MDYHLSRFKTSFAATLGTVAARSLPKIFQVAYNNAGVGKHIDQSNSHLAPSRNLFVGNVPKGPGRLVVPLPKVLPAWNLPQPARAVVKKKTISRQKRKAKPRGQKFSRSKVTVAKKKTTMPRRYKRKRSTKRRRRNTTLVISQQPTPPQITCKLLVSYSTILTTNAAHGTVAAANVLSIRSNSCYDPLGAASAQQPLGFDDWFRMYDKARVLRSEIVVQAVCTATTATARFPTVGILNDTDPYVPTKADQIIEQGRGVVAHLSDLHDRAALRLTFDPKKVTGHKAIGDDLTEFYDGADCGRTAYFNIWVANGAGLSTLTAAPVALHITVEYTVNFFARKDMAASVGV